MLESTAAVANEPELSYRRVNAPYLGTYPPVSFEPTIFWFGEVTPTTNYTDVRVYYYESHLTIVFHTIDRRLWFDLTKSEPDFTNWDAVSLYLDMAGNTGGVPSANTYLIRSQLDFQVIYRWNGSAWEPAPITITTEASWRGNYPNDNTDDKGWQVKFEIPFSSLGLSGPPSTGTTWGMAVMVHDRDDSQGTPIPDQIWPEAMDANNTYTWGQLVFNPSPYQPPRSLSQGVTTVKQGLDGAVVEDAHVGGHTICGSDVEHWTEWGEANYAGYTQMNIQNQWDISDWPCFSKYYVTFPVGNIPPNKVIIHATLTMTHFGNAGGGDWGEPPDSYIQVFTVGEAWDEATLTWNNAPLAVENIAGTWVYPRDYSLPDQPYHWNVTGVVNDTYQTGQPLRLALYSADGERHSGKYFWTSDGYDWGRPTLSIVWGEPCSAAEIECNFTYLPITIR